MLPQTSPGRLPRRSPPGKPRREPVHRSRATSAARDWLGKLKEVVSFCKLETEHAGVDVKRCSAFVAASSSATPSRVRPRREYYSRGSTCRGRIFRRVFTRLDRACTSSSNFSNGSTRTQRSKVPFLPFVFEGLETRGIGGVLLFFFATGEHSRGRRTFLSWKIPYRSVAFCLVSPRTCYSAIFVGSFINCK